MSWREVEIVRNERLNALARADARLHQLGLLSKAAYSPTDVGPLSGRLIAAPNLFKKIPVNFKTITVRSIRRRFRLATAASHRREDDNGRSVVSAVPPANGSISSWTMERALRNHALLAPATAWTFPVLILASLLRD